ncbi:hypothetical protein [Endozoicomonas lisbonensis]|uniref:hypothetical protein n=1 Tax=Endozoicomonas lisbonensis TaxID=3120522 RepID=UPI00339388DB
MPTTKPLLKRSRTVTATKPDLEECGGCFFVPTDLETYTGFIPSPVSEIRKAIDCYQQNNLEVKTGAVHNRGVFLKDSAAPVKKGQVLAIYRGTAVNLRELDKEEFRLCGYPECEPVKWLVWAETGGVPALSQRPASYQAHTPHISYLDQKRRKVNIGVDAIDSIDAISHTNSQQECDNIEFVVCLNDELVRSNTKHATILRRKPTEQDYCFLAVACKDIQPGSELFLDYGKSQSRMAHFWAPDQYFYPTLCPRAVSVHFSEDGTTVSVRASDAGEEQVKLESLKNFIYEKLDFWKRHSIDRLIYTLNQYHQNPFTGGQDWVEGDVQYLFERWNIEVFRSPHYLTYLFHCFNIEGKLDNNGVNYIYAFIKSKNLTIAPPGSRPVYIEEVIGWLKHSIEIFEGPDSERQLDILENQLQLLEVQQYRRMAEGEEKKQCLRKEGEKLHDYIRRLKVALGPGGKIKSPTHYRLTARFLSPSELWPDIFREIPVWSLAHLKCLALRENPSEEVDPIDRIDCYRFDSPEYAQAMHEALRRRQVEGAKFEAIRTTVNSGGLLPVEFRFQSVIEKNYQIPHVEGIPAQLRGTSNWLDLTVEHWRLLGFEETSLSPLRTVIERITSKKKGLYGTLHAVCRYDSEHRHLWISDPCIKDKVKKDKSKTMVLLKHLINKSGAIIDVTTPAHQWQPIDTLMVCKPESEDYQSAMKMLLNDAVANGKSLYEIAVLLDADMGSSTIPVESKGKYRVDLPETLHRYNKWTPPAVSDLLASFNLPQPTGCDPQAELKSLIEGYIFAGEVNSVSGVVKRLRGLLAKRPDVAKDLADILYLNPRRLESLNHRGVRYIFAALDIKVHETAIKSDFEPVAFDKIHAITDSHPDWPKEVMRVVNFYKNRGESDQFIVEILNKGTRSPFIKLVIDPIPLPPGCQAKQWTVDVLKGFIQSCEQPPAVPVPPAASMDVDESLCSGQAKPETMMIEEPERSVSPPEIPKHELQLNIARCIRESAEVSSQALVKSISRMFKQDSALVVAVSGFLHIKPEKLQSPTPPLVRYLLSSLEVEIIPDELKTEMQLQLYDTINSISEHHPGWAGEVLKLINELASFGQSYGAIAKMLKSGRVRGQQMFDPVPVPEGIRGEQWTEKNLKAFIAKHG